MIMNIGKLILSLSLLLAFCARAEFIAVELENVPVKRLQANLNDHLAAKPDDPVIHQRLARLHAMAYVKNFKSDDETVPVQKGKKDPWFGHVPNNVPYAPHPSRPVVAKRPTKVAKAHLAKAIQHYKKAIALKPDALTRLGLGWCAKEAGDKKLAITQFKLVVDEAWEQEQKAKFGGMARFVAEEAIGYYLPLLDEKKDAATIADLKKKILKLKELIRPITPIVIPLQNEVSLEAIIDRSAKVRFDLDGTGRQLSWEWIDGSVAGWLVHDPKQSGRITSSIQMFGSRSFLMFFEHGYEALALLDDDHSGALRGEELRGLAIWQDRNGNGVSEEGEVRSLAHHGITGLSTAATKGEQNMYFSAHGVEFSDGSKRNSYDVVLKGAK